MPLIHLGCAMWTLPQWRSTFFPAALSANQHLSYYSQHYTSVEGNSTFYALPSDETFKKWSNSVSEGFKFCFKLPREITHERHLHDVAELMQAYLTRLSPLIQKQQLGKVFVQLPPNFSAAQSPALVEFIQTYKKQLPLAVEVRHPEFFNKSESERELNRLLMAHNIDRVMIDTRPVHTEKADNPATIDAQKKKPKLPVHVLATGQHPIVRFIGQMQTEQNMAFIQPWLAHFKQWIAQGRQPFLFIHSADNANVHALAALWQQMLQPILEQQPFANDFSSLVPATQNSLF
ncbi:DUF72 domain-containing protein [Gayadomonas joobiniege]|uniref:DUF72 domain-containing protein n=1 Tax=Gayadomonas joobiniege TaxID=1234606 RepID=UPI00036D83A0|nr:DUF72 domain-containing protein [Gayadomonas joobiniege]